MEINRRRRLTEHMFSDPIGLPIDEDKVNGKEISSMNSTARYRLHKHNYRTHIRNCRLSRPSH
ncbi:hypothetical protein LINGRAHAP2_LOCUS29688 [Linum grandiflorum]